MSSMTLQYTGQLRTQGTHLASGNTVVTDAPVDNNGRGEAYSPTDLVCSALGSCMMTIMGMVADRNHIDLTGMTMAITKRMAADPRRISEIVLEVQMPARDFSEKERAMLENAARTCPVALSLHPELTQTVLFQYA
ncbi:OsmC family protein [Rufibacter sp. LB8]|uniref:OsmC family protein n=2 Tax=Rufibacter sp. LB8 TaxID=2777781 RepID=UPI00178C23D1|nr:OsmC family protein [Rufibacter sp. LB8]